MTALCVPPRRRGLPTLFVLALLAGCSLTSGELDRTGPSFRDAFPDPSILLSSEDVGALRAKLSRTPLPTTLEHHELLGRTLEERSEVRTENLLLLTEAVSVWPEGAVQPSELPTTGTGPYAEWVDRLLLEGAKRLEDFQPGLVGTMLERTQSPEGMAELAEVLVMLCDAGDPQTLVLLLDGFEDGDCQADFVIDTLMDRGVVVGEKRWLVLRALRSRAAMRRVANEVILRDPDFEAGTLATLLRQAQTDGARLEYLDLALEWLSFEDPADRCAVLQAFSFDRERYQALDRLLLESRSRPWTDEAWATVAATFSFDSTRLQMILDLWGGDRVRRFGEILPAAAWLEVPEERFGLLRRVARRTGSSVEPVDLAVAASLFTQDQDRRLVLDNLRRHLDRLLTVKDAELILDEFDQGTGRIHVLSVFAADFWKSDDPLNPVVDPATLDPHPRTLLQFFELESHRREAEDLLRSPASSRSESG